MFAAVIDNRTASSTVHSTGALFSLSVNEISSRQPVRIDAMYIQWWVSGLEIAGFQKPQKTLVVNVIFDFAACVVLFTIDVLWIHN